LLSIYENDILTLASALEQGKGLSSIARNWRDAVSDYRSKLQDVERNGAHAPALDGDTLLKLLAAALPVSAVVSELRTAAQRATTSDARDCSWFRNLGDPDKASVGAIMIMPHVIREAEAGAKQRKRDYLVNDFPYKMMFPGGCLFVLMAAVVGLFQTSPDFWDSFGSDILSDALGLIIVVGLIAMVLSGLVVKSTFSALMSNISNDLKRAEVVSKWSLRGALMACAVLALILPLSLVISKSKFATFESLRLTKVALVLNSPSTGGNGSQIAFIQGEAPNLSFEISGPIRSRDRKFAELVDSNGERIPLSLRCRNRSCNIDWTTRKLLHGEYRLEIEYVGASKLERNIVIFESFEGLPVVDYGFPRDGFYQLQNDQWAGFDVPQVGCLHQLDVLDRIVKEFNVDRTRVYFRSTDEDVRADIVTAAVGQTRNLRTCQKSDIDDD
jgi:hypothetical protein